MGMFDEVQCRYPIPEIPKAAEWLWQSKYTPAQHLDLYEIRAGGTLWHQATDVRVEVTDAAPLGFYVHRENPRWLQVSDFVGELEIHHFVGEPPAHTWYSVRFWFRDGCVKDVAVTIERPEDREHGTKEGCADQG